MERKFTEEEAEKIKTNARNIIQCRKELEEIYKRMDDSEHILRQIIFGENNINHHLTIPYNDTNHIIFSYQYDWTEYLLNIDTLKIERK